MSRVKEIESRIEEIGKEIEEFGENHDFHDGYNDMLDECYPEMFGHLPSTILKEVDPIQYKCGYSDYVDSLQCDDFVGCHEYQELKEQLEELQEELEELEYEQ